MSAKLINTKGIVRDEEPSVLELQFDFERDRHYRIRFEAGESFHRIADRLRELAARIDRDPFLYQKN